MEESRVTLVIVEGDGCGLFERREVTQGTAGMCELYLDLATAIGRMMDDPILFLAQVLHYGGLGERVGPRDTGPLLEAEEGFLDAARHLITLNAQHVLARREQAGADPAG